IKMSPFHAAGEQWQMMEGSLLRSRKERKRLALLAQVKSGDLKLVTAGGGVGGGDRPAKRGGGGAGAGGEVMGVAYRQAKGVWRRSGVEGDAGLVHRSRGRPSPRRKPAALRQRVLARYRSGTGRWRAKGAGITWNGDIF